MGEFEKMGGSSPLTGKTAGTSAGSLYHKYRPGTEQRSGAASFITSIFSHNF